MGNAIRRLGQSLKGRNDIDTGLEVQAVIDEFSGEEWWYGNQLHC